MLLNSFLIGTALNVYFEDTISIESFHQILEFYRNFKYSSHFCVWACFHSDPDIRQEDIRHGFPPSLSFMKWGPDREVSGIDDHFISGTGSLIGLHGDSVKSHLKLLHKDSRVIF